MANFHETVMGRKFFESTLPKIVSSLDLIAKKLEIQGKDPVIENAFEEHWKLFKAKIYTLSKHCSTLDLSKEEEIEVTAISRMIKIAKLISNGEMTNAHWGLFKSIVFEAVVDGFVQTEDALELAVLKKMASYIKEIEEETRQKVS